MSENILKLERPELIPEEELTLDLFWEHWGEKCELEREQLESLWEFAESQCSDLSAHNFTHGKNTLWTAMDYADFCEANGLEVNRKLLVGTTLLLGAGFHKDYRELGFESEEELSAFVWEQNAGQFGYGPADIVAGRKNILSRQPDAETHSIEDIILNRADKSNVSGSYAHVFRVRTQHFIDEARKLNPDFSHVRFAAESLSALLQYARKDLSFGDFDDEQLARFALLNLKRLSIDYTRREGAAFVRYARSLGDEALNKLLDTPLPRVASVFKKEKDD